jgi:aminopeptidase N
MKSYVSFKISFFIACFIITGCKKSPENGVSQELAKERKELLSHIEYSLQFSIPPGKTEKITGKADIAFMLNKRNEIVIDFRENGSNIKKVCIGEKSVSYQFTNGHIIVPKKYVKAGYNIISVDFIAGEGSLNRKSDFLYTLFVPDRASTAFPCFDQPDLKSVYKLTLDIPKTWTAVSNGPVLRKAEKDSSISLSFGPTKPISTYLFAFASGKFDSISRTVEGRKITIYHRENDTLKVRRNLDAIFTSHFHSLDWLKDYTGIDYPFGKLDIILIPDFQYSGMEHPGAIYYRDSQLFLSENPSVNQKLGQASLIAHEVSHQWFGDLVTMRWFNDVWLKEVFAGFMADKIVNPLYPEINHDLNFLLSHTPRAYSIDRTEGANPIRQNLDNLLFAGTLYGDIIYHKAPIMMRQLELLMGAESFKQGIREYLLTYSMNNAGWEDLVSILDPLTAQELKSWSNAWVDLPGMPEIKTRINYNTNGSVSEYSLMQSGKDAKSPTLGMKFGLIHSSLDSQYLYQVEMICDTITVAGLHNNSQNGWILPDADGKGYGTFFPDSASFQKLSDTSLVIKDNLYRASWFVILNELFLNGKIGAESYFSYLLSNISRETVSQTRQYLLNSLEMVWWRFFSIEQRKAGSKHIENNLSDLLYSPEIKDEERKPLFWTFTRVALSREAVNTIYRVWSNETGIKGINFDESDYMIIACELAVRGIRISDSILTVQEKRIINADRLDKFRFMKRALATDDAVRDSFFISLSDPANRRPEPWVTEALRYFHHPLREKYSIGYLRPALDLLPEIQRTGDIFFPKSWLDATLWGYRSAEAYGIVDNWLKENQQLSENLRDKVLQSADNLKRASASKNFRSAGIY